MYLLTEWKGRTGKYLARGHGVRTERNEVGANLVPRSHSVTGNVRSGKVRQYTHFHWLLKKRLRQCNLRSDLLISWGTSVKVK